MINKIKPSSPDIYLGKTIGDNTLARLAHVNQLVDQINNESPVDSRPYKVFTALLTQSGGDGPNYLTRGIPLTIGVTYTIYSIGSSGWDLTNVGAPNNDIGTTFIATGEIPNSYGSGGDPEYVTFNTGAPVATVLENTIGNVWFTYVGVGQYNINSDGLFIQNKTAYFITNTNTVDLTLIFLTPNDIPNAVNIQSANQLGTFTDSLFFNIPIEIRVYN